MIFGTLIDDSCILWQESCHETGACLVYDNSSLSRYLADYPCLFHALNFPFKYIVDIDNNTHFSSLHWPDTCYTWLCRPNCVQRYSSSALGGSTYRPNTRTEVSATTTKHCQPHKTHSTTKSSFTITIGRVLMRRTYKNPFKSSPKELHCHLLTWRRDFLLSQRIVALIRQETW